MKEINIKDLKINVEISSVLEYINSKKAFEMDFYGKIYALNEAEKTTPLVFKTNDNTFSNEILNETIVNSSNENQIQTILENIFGKEYKIKTTASHFEIRPVGAWLEIIGLNQGRMTYFDHQTDGVEIFEEKELEDIGWQAVSLNIKYRDICMHLEKECEGFLIYYDNGMHFNGFVIVKSIEEAKGKMHQLVHAHIEEKIKDEELILDELEDDEKQALAFFKYKG
ncbi:MAG: hypothetical protein WC141_08835 [Arcobacteraceae bacterium]